MKKVLLSALWGTLSGAVSPAIKRILADEVLSKLEGAAAKTRNGWDDFLVHLLRRIATEG